MMIYNDNTIKLYKSVNNIPFQNSRRETLKTSTTKSNKKHKKEKGKLNRKNKQFLQSLGYKLK